MSHPSCAALARLYNIASYSLPIYLQTAAPWTPAGESEAIETLAQLAGDQRRLSRRVFERLTSLECAPPQGDFPSRFTWLNDLSLQYLLRRLVEEQAGDIAKIERCAAQLTADLPSRVLAEEALGAARGHLERLQELSRTRGG